MPPFTGKTPARYPLQSPISRALDALLKGKTWLAGERLTIADFSVGGLVPSAERLGLPVKDFPEIVRWYSGLAALPAWEKALAARTAALAAWQAKKTP